MHERLFGTRRVGDDDEPMFADSRHGCRATWIAIFRPVWECDERSDLASKKVLTLTRIGRQTRSHLWIFFFFFFFVFPPPPGGFTPPMMAMVHEPRSRGSHVMWIFTRFDFDRPVCCF